MSGFDLDALRGEDDTPVLAYADWVEERGDGARAELIRLECRLARSECWAAGFTAARVRADRLFSPESATRWSPELDPLYTAGLRLFDVGLLFNFFHARPGDDPPPLNGYERKGLFERGLLAWAALTPDNLSAHFDRLYAALPIRHLTLASIAPPTRPLPPDALRPISALCIRQPSAGGDLSWLEPAFRHASPGGGLRTLEIGDDALTPEAPWLLARSEALSGVRQLKLSVDDTTLAELAGHLRNWGLESLTLSGEFTADHLPRLLSGRTAETLQSLRLCPLSGPATAHAAAVADSSLPALESLDLSNTTLDSSAVDRLTGSPSLPTMADLNLEGARIRNPARLTFPLGPGRRPLARLSLKDCRLPPRCLARLFQSPALAALHWLDLRDNTVSDPALLSLVRSPMSATLRWLQFESTPVTDKSVTALAAAAFPQLEVLKLGLTGITEESVVAVLESPTLPRLCSFDAGIVPVGSESLRRALAGPRLRELVELELVLETGSADLDRLADRAILPKIQRLVLGGEGNAALRRLWAIYEDVLDMD